MKLSRRSFLRTVSGTVAAFGAAGVVVGSAQAATDSDPSDAAGRGYRGVTDNDSGANADPAGHGHSQAIVDLDCTPEGDPIGNRIRDGYTGVTDTDTGTNADPAGNGQGPPSGLTDNDKCSGGDPSPYGPNRTTDSDVRNLSDPVGNGRGPGGNYTGVTDRDTGSTSDPDNYGRGTDH